MEKSYNETGFLVMLGVTSRTTVYRVFVEEIML